MTIKRFTATISRNIEIEVDTKKFTRKVMNMVNKDDKIHAPLEKCDYSLEKHVARIAKIISYQDQYSLENNELEPSDVYGNLHKIGINVCRVFEPNCDNCDEA